MSVPSGICVLETGHATKRNNIEYDEKWVELIAEIPYLNFPSDWNVKIIPPFAGAVARFLVSKGETQVSVYLDWYGQLGAMQMPYYEIYPSTHGEPERFNLLPGSIVRMMETIAEVLDKPTDLSGN